MLRWQDDRPEAGDPTPEEIAQRAAEVRARWRTETQGGSAKRPGSDIGRRDRDAAPGIREFNARELGLGAASRDREP